MATPKTDLTIIESTLHPGKHLVYQRSILVGVLACAKVRAGKGERWSVLWRRDPAPDANAPATWVAGDGASYPDRGQAAEAALVTPT